MSELQGVRVLLTGATSGLGSAMADALLRAGATVAAAARPGARLETWAAERAGAGLEVLPAAMDVRDVASVRVAVDQVVARFGGLDLLVNNAGAGMRLVNEDFLTRPQPFWEVSPEAFADAVATNMTGYFLVARAVAPLLVAAGHGRIVNVTTNYATMQRRGFVPYGPSRAGSEALSLVMAQDLAPHGVSVNLLLPGGATRSGMTEGLPVPPATPLLEPEVMGPPIVFLASAEAEGLSGARIVASEFGEFLESFRASRQCGAEPPPLPSGFLTSPRS